MASMNNWLGFSLSPQELPSQSDHSQNTPSSRLGFQSDEISGTDVVSGECFDFTSDSTAPSLNIPTPFGIPETFRNNHPQDWNMKGLGMNPETNFKTTADLSMIMGTSCNTQHFDQNQEPKLEIFLGDNSFANHEQHKLPGCNTIYDTSSTGDYMFQNCSLHLPSDATTTNERTSSRGGGGGGGGVDTGINNGSSSSNNINNGSSTIGLSMIKTWLRNQSAPTPQKENKNNINGGAQSLSLSMSTGSQSATVLPLLAASGGGNGGGDQSSSDNNKQQKTVAPLDAQTGAIEAVPRKSIDTFGQRTSIYRGVTRYF